MEFKGFIDLLITRKWFFRDSVVGYLEIPFYGFKCYCMEHKQDNNAKLKLNTALPHGQYLMKPVVKDGVYPTPQISHKMKGYVKPPYVCAKFTQLKDLPSGCITIGKKSAENKLIADDAVSENFVAVMHKAFQRVNLVTMLIAETSDSVFCDDREEIKGLNFTDEEEDDE